VKAAPGGIWNAAVIARAVSLSCAQARRKRSVSGPSGTWNDLSKRAPSPVRQLVVVSNRRTARTDCCRPSQTLLCVCCRQLAMSYFGDREAGERPRNHD
jgi:hypothetical protein